MGRSSGRWGAQKPGAAVGPGAPRAGRLPWVRVRGSRAREGLTRLWVRWRRAAADRPLKVTMTHYPRLDFQFGSKYNFKIKGRACPATGIRPAAARHPRNSGLSIRRAFPHSRDVRAAGGAKPTPADDHPPWRVSLRCGLPGTYPCGLRTQVPSCPRDCGPGRPLHPSPALRENRGPGRKYGGATPRLFTARPPGSARAPTYPVARFC